MSHKGWPFWLSAPRRAASRPGSRCSRPGAKHARCRGEDRQIAKPCGQMPVPAPPNSSRGHDGQPEAGLQTEAQQQFSCPFPCAHVTAFVLRDGMNILFLGDIIGKPGRDVVAAELPRLRSQLELDLVIANGENAAGGFGLTRAIAEEFFAVGVDVITTGNHWADQKEILAYIDDRGSHPAPANYPKGTPGRAPTSIRRRGGSVLVINVMGRVFMDALDDPFAAVERELAACPLGEGADAIVVDIHAEATSEKMAMGHFCDGRASLVVGTHQHVPTADAQIFPGGTAYQSRCRGLRRLRLRHRHGQGRAGAALHAQDVQPALRAGHRPRHAVRRVRGNRRARASPPASSRCASAGG